MSNKVAINVNLSNMAVTQFCEYNYNSFCEIAGKHFGASEDGIFELTGNDDAGVGIDAFFELAISDFGISNMKRIRSAYVGGQADGSLLFTVKDDESSPRPYPLNLTSGNVQSNGEVPVGRDGLGRYWQVRIDNQNGAYFAIDSIELLLMILGRKPR